MKCAAGIFGLQALYDERQGEKVDWRYAVSVAQNDTRLLGKDAFELAFLVMGRLLGISVPKGNPTDDTLDRPAPALSFPEIRTSQVGPVKASINEIGLHEDRPFEV